jgi:ribA/ribD-fused uncharacterized protein
MADGGAILFRGQESPFSNFYPAPFLLDGEKWPTTEHYFQAAKFPGLAQAQKIQCAATPAVAKKLGGSRAAPLRADWETKRNDVMRAAVLAKFRQNPALAATLLATGNRDLVEVNSLFFLLLLLLFFPFFFSFLRLIPLFLVCFGQHTGRDGYWGDGKNGTGKNMLGKILMETRAILSQEAAGEDEPVAKKHCLSGDSDSSATAGAVSAAAAAVAPIVSGSLVQVRSGDLLDAPEQYIAQQCNTVSKSAKGLSAAMFARFPHANVYNGAVKVVRKPGAISVHGDPGRLIINMCIQCFVSLWGGVF